MTVHNPKQRFKLIVAVYLVLRRDNQILLLKRLNTGYQDGKYSMIAGHVDGGELASDTMAREAKEEAGIIIDPKKLHLVHLAHRLCAEQTEQERIDLFFELREWKGKIQNMEPQKCADLSWFPIDNLPKNIIPFVGLTIKNITNNVYYSEYVTEPE